MGSKDRMDLNAAIADLGRTALKCLCQALTAWHTHIDETVLRLRPGADGAALHVYKKFGTPSHLSYFSLSTNPLINSRCIATTTITGGIMASMAVAMVTGQFP